MYFSKEYAHKKKGNDSSSHMLAFKDASLISATTQHLCETFTTGKYSSGFIVLGAPRASPAFNPPK